MRTYWKATLLFTILLSVSSLAFSQQSNISGKVTDEKNNPVAYASIVFKLGQKGLATDIEGRFSFICNENDLTDSVYITVMGYERKTLSVSSLLQTAVVTLQPKSYELFTISVSAKEAENIVRKAVQKITENYPQQPYFIPVFFRQFHRENGKAARLIEAALNVYDPGYVTPQSVLLKEQFEVIELRRSNVFEKNGFTHDDHIIDLFKQNLVHYPRETILNLSAIDFFHFEKDEIQHSDTVICIKFSYQNPSDPKTRWGKLYINTMDFAILRMEENTGKNKNYNPMLGAANKSEWHFTEGEMVVNYKLVSGKYFLDSISFFYRHNIISKVFGTTDFTVDEYFNFWTGIPDLVDVPDNMNNKHFQKTGNLYSKKYNYNPEIWNNYELVLKHPLNPTITSEFEKNTKLEEQFLNNGEN